ncbi:MAG: diguanylate cyclase [Eubacteriales bacterium]|nr:diguanylate cyclase [Eubacteriales bacterium]
MKIRSRIFLILVPIMLISVVISNLIFGAFFNNYLIGQENAQLVSVSNNISSYFSEKIKAYQGTANDWGHWDDTYEYLNNENPDYIELNLVEDTFIYLDINFILFFDDDGAIFYKQFYNFDEEQFTEFEDGFFEDFDKVIEIANLEEDTSSLYKLGSEYYFTASTDVTDSLAQANANGKMIIGRQLDDNVISYIESIADSSLKSIDTIVFDSGEGISEEDIMDGILINEKELEFECILPNTLDAESSVKLTFIKSRDLYLSGREQLNKFLIGNIIAMLVVAAILFTILGIYLSKPFMELTREVKNIDITGEEIEKIHPHGKGEFAFLRNSINNLLTRIEAEQSKVKENEEKLYATLLSVGDGVIVISRDNEIQFLNPVAQKLTGWAQQEAIGEASESVFNIINEYTREKVESPVNEVYKTESIVELSNHTMLVSKDGTEKAIEDTAAPIKDKHNKVVGCIIVFRDFSEKKEKQKKIEYLSYHDQLTGLYNRRYFEEEVKRLDTKRNLPISFVYADVNGLKTINDAFGHQSGDQLIQQIAEVFKAECRADDIIARTGGDEFIVLLPKTAAPSVEKLVMRIKEKVEQEKIMGICLSLSFGWDTKNVHEQAVWEVLKNAENYMYRKKFLSNDSKRSATIKSILNTLHIMCPREEEHAKRVSLLCEEIGKAYHLDDDKQNELKMSGELHDIGKIAIEKAIINKDSELSESEWAQIRNHPEIGYRILSTSREFYNIAEYVLAHHERWDGKGYPKGLKDEGIHWESRVIAIADAYDSMRSEQPYRKSLSEEEAVAEIKRNAGTQFDTEIARVFVEKVLGARW